MSHLKLPKPKKKGKSRAAAPEPSSYEEAIEAALEFEETADRYRSGDKAINNWNRALDAYKQAIAFDASHADPYYNSARILQTLAEEHVAATEANARLDEAIQAYAAASQRDPQSTDIAFNWAMALVSKSEHQSDPAPTQMQALNLLQRLETQQRQIMAGQTFDPSAPEADMEDEQEDATKQVTSQTLHIVPSLIAETILAAIDIMLSLLDAPSPPDDLSNQISAAFARAAELAAEPPVDEDVQLALKDTQLDMRLASLHSAFEATGQLDPTWPDLMAAFEAAFRRDESDLQRCCDWADALSDLAFILSQIRDSSAAAVIEQGIQVYSQLAKLLSSPLTAKSLSPNSIAPTHANVLSSLSMLLALKKDSQAMESAIRAVVAADIGVTFKPGQGFIKSAGGRSDWNAVKAAREAALTLCRTAFLARDVSAQQHAQELLKNLKVQNEALKSWVEDANGDALWTAEEERYWHTLSAASV